MGVNLLKEKRTRDARSEVVLINLEVLTFEVGYVCANTESF